MVLTNITINDVSRELGVDLAQQLQERFGGARLTIPKRAVVPDRDKRIRELFWLGHTRDEIAAIVGLAPDTVRKITNKRDDPAPD